MNMEIPPTSEPLYKTLMGTAWDSLPDKIRDLHDIQTAARAEGRATVRRGTGWRARLVAALFRFPSAGTDIPVQVDFAVRNGVETWTRTFGTQAFRSRQYAADGQDRGALIEQFGPFYFTLRLQRQDGQLHLIVKHGRFFFLPLPRALCPQSTAFEYVVDGQFHFDVAISHPLTGLIVHYQGYLRRTSSSVRPVAG